MKTLISAKEENLESAICPYFARADYFLLFETGKTLKFLKNPYKNDSEDVGLKVADWAIKKGIKRVVSSEFGSKAGKRLDDSNIQRIIIPATTTLSQIIEMLTKNVKINEKPIKKK